MKKNLFFITALAIIGLSTCLSVGTVNAQCPNADFSMGNFTNWTGTTGYYALGVYHPYGGMTMGTTNSNKYATDLGRQTIITQSQTDPETRNILNELPPGAYSAARLGNPRTSSCDSTNGKAQEEELAYTYYVNSSNCIFTYQYAVVLHDPGNAANHTALSRPKFSIHVLNQSGALVDSTCSYYEVVAQQGAPGFYCCNPDPLDACDNTDSVLWKNWTSVSVDLSAYIGSAITIQFATRDCNPNEKPGRHFGYAYIHCSCGSFTLAQQCTGPSDLVTAPAGYATYEWSYINSSGTTVDTSSTSNTITVNPVPAGHTITCVCTSVTGCKFTYTHPLSIGNPVFTPATPIICSGQTDVITAHGNVSYTYNWSTGVSDSTILVSPPRDTSYTVTATAPGGCTSSATVTVNVNSLPVTPTITQQGDSLISNATTGNQWYNDNGSIQGENSQYYVPALSGNYYTIATDNNGCISDTSNKIYVFITGLSAISDNNKTYIYPNPVTNKLFIEVSQKATIEILNIQGQLLETLITNGNKTSIDISSFPSEVYIVEVRTEKEIAVKKFVKE